MKKVSPQHPHLPGMTPGPTPSSLSRLRKRYSAALSVKANLSQQLAEKMATHDHLISSEADKLDREAKLKLTKYVGKLAAKLKPLQTKKRKAERVAESIAQEYGKVDPAGVADLIMSALNHPSIPTTTIDEPTNSSSVPAPSAE
ncbi:hypothetical protein CCP2SC5_740017 [Azospirillaceae bacterium]